MTMCPQVQRSRWHNGARWLLRFLCCNSYQPFNRKPAAAHETRRLRRLARNGRFVGAGNYYPFRCYANAGTMDRWRVIIGAGRRNRTDKGQRQMRTVALRIVATFVYSAMSIVGGASVLGGIPVWKAAVLAGIAAASQVLERLARAYADDGKISRSEIDEAFGTGAQ